MTKNILKTIYFILLFALFHPLQAYATQNVIVIGHAIDLSGENAAIGRDYVAGIKTYFDSINAKGGVHGKKIRYIVRDDQGKPELSTKLVTELIEQDQIEFLIGGVGNASMQAALGTTAFKRSNLILYAPLSTANAADSRVLFWRPNYRQEVKFLLSHFNKLGIKNIGIAIQGTSRNEDEYRSLSTELLGHGMTLAGVAQLGERGEKGPQEAGRLAAKRPEVVIVIADTIATGLFLKEFRKHAAQVFVAGTSLTNLATLNEMAGIKAVEWTVFSQVVPNPNASSTLIQAEHHIMMKKYRDEAVSSLTLEGFAVAKTLIKSIELAKNHRMALQELMIRRSDIDLGGLSVAGVEKNNILSSYLDIALLRKGNQLVF